MACTFVGTKFPHRVPVDKIISLRCFFGGAGNESVLDESDESLITIAREELRAILGLRPRRSIRPFPAGRNPWRNMSSAMLSV